MSGRVASLVYGKVLGAAVRKAVLAYCADRADDQGRGIWASKSTIAAATETGRSTVIRVVNEFVAEGILKAVGKRPGRNGPTVVYDIDLAALARLPDAVAEVEPSAGLVHATDQSHIGTSPTAGPVPERELTSPTAGPKPSMNRPKRDGANAPSAGGSKPHPKFRIPEDWRPSEVGVAFAREHLPDEVSREELQGFRIYWTDRGERKSAAGWEQTWRNRVRDVAARLSRRPPTPPNGSRSKSNERLSAWFDEARAPCGPDMARGSDRDPPQALLRG